MTTEGTFSGSSDAMLFNSSASGDKEGVIAALAQGGRVTVRDPNGWTPLLSAADKGHNYESEQNVIDLISIEYFS